MIERSPFEKQPLWQERTNKSIFDPGKPGDSIEIEPPILGKKEDREKRKKKRGGMRKDQRKAERDKRTTDRREVEPYKREKPKDEEE